MDTYTFVLSLVVFLGVILTRIFWAYFEKRTAKETKAKIAQAEARVQEAPGKAKPAWDLAQATLEAYFNKNLSQIASIFWLSVAVMLVGFAMLLYAIMQSVQQPTDLVPAYIASISGIITENAY